MTTTNTATVLVHLNLTVEADNHAAAAAAARDYLVAHGISYDDIALIDVVDW